MKRFKDTEGGGATVTVVDHAGDSCGCEVSVLLELETGKPAYGGAFGVVALSRKQTKKLIKALRRTLEGASE